MCVGLQARGFYERFASGNGLGAAAHTHTHTHTHTHACAHALQQVRASLRSTNGKFS